MPRRPSIPDPDKPASNKGRVRFIFEPDRSSPNGVTYSWLIHRTYKGKEKAATATRAFWLPFAYQDAGSHSEAELKDLAQQSIWRLEEQIQHLKEMFGITASSTQANDRIADVTVDLPSHGRSALPASDISRPEQDDWASDFEDAL